MIQREYRPGALAPPRVPLRAVRIYHITIPLSVVLAGTGFYLAWSNRPAPPPGPVHPVTNDMLVKSERMKLKDAPDFKLKALNGMDVSLDQAMGGKPTLLFFIKDGCPCSTEAEPLFQALKKHHGEKISMVGIIDVAPEKAKEWAKTHEADHLILCDPSLATMKAYDSPNSAYTTLIATDKKIEKQWPGYSQSFLKEENALLAKLTGEKERPFDTLYAPVANSSGCSFFETPPKK